MRDNNSFILNLPKGREFEDIGKDISAFKLNMY